METTKTSETYRPASAEVEITPKEIDQAQGEAKQLEAEKTEIEEKLIPLAEKLQKYDKNWRVETLVAWVGTLTEGGQEAFKKEVSDNDYRALVGKKCMDVIVENMRERIIRLKFEVPFIRDRKIPYMWRLHREWKKAFPKEGKKGLLRLPDIPIMDTLVVGGVMFTYDTDRYQGVCYEPYVKGMITLDGTEDISLRC